jgi:hypothetical protein
MEATFLDTLANSKLEDFWPLLQDRFPLTAHELQFGYEESDIIRVCRGGHVFSSLVDDTTDEWKIPVLEYEFGCEYGEPVHIVKFHPMYLCKSKPECFLCVGQKYNRPLLELVRCDQILNSLSWWSGEIPYFTFISEVHEHWENKCDAWGDSLYSNVKPAKDK